MGFRCTDGRDNRIAADRRSDSVWPRVFKVASVCALAVSTTGLRESTAAVSLRCGPPSRHSESLPDASTTRVQRCSDGISRHGERHGRGRITTDRGDGSRRANAQRQLFTISDCITSARLGFRVATAAARRFDSLSGVGEAENLLVDGTERIMCRGLDAKAAQTAIVAAHHADLLYRKHYGATDRIVVLPSWEMDLFSLQVDGAFIEARRLRYEYRRFACPWFSSSTAEESTCVDPAGSPRLLRVGRTTNAGKLAGAIAHSIQTRHRQAVISVRGSEAVYQAINAITRAESYLRRPPERRRDGLDGSQHSANDVSVKKSTSAVKAVKGARIALLTRMGNDDREGKVLMLHCFPIVDQSGDVDSANEKKNHRHVSLQVCTKGETFTQTKATSEVFAAHPGRLPHQASCMFGSLGTIGAPSGEPFGSDSVDKCAFILLCFARPFG